MQKGWAKLSLVTWCTAAAALSNQLEYMDVELVQYQNTGQYAQPPMAQSGFTSIRQN